MTLAASWIGGLQLALAAAGLAVLVVWIVFLARDRNLLPGGPEPVAGFTLVDAAVALALWLAVQVMVSSTASALGMERGPDMALLVKVGETFAAGLVVLAFLSRNPAHGRRVRGAAAGLLCCLGTLPVVWAVLLAWQTLYQAAGWEWAEQEILVQLRSTARWKFVLLATVLAPLTEEVIFRGVIQTTVKKLAGKWAGVLASAALFTLVHLSLPVAPAIFVLGVALSLTYERTGTLASTIAFHSLFNAVTVVGEVLSGSG